MAGDAGEFRVPLYKTISKGRLNAIKFLQRSRQRRASQARVVKTKAPTVRRPYSEWYFKEKRPPEQSDWFKYNAVGLWSDPAHARGKIFRRRFRVPHHFFLELLLKIDFDDSFISLRATEDCTGKKSSCTCLLVLACFRLLGRGVHFDDLEEATNLSRETHRKYFLRFIRVYKQVVFPAVVHPPAGDDLAEELRQSELAGVPGKLCSTDCTHIEWHGCAANLKNLCTNGKNGGSTTLVFEISVGHNRKIFSVSDSFYGTYSDKTVVLFDDLPMGVHKGKICSGLQFKLVTVEGVEYLETGVWSYASQQTWFRGPRSRAAPLISSRAPPPVGGTH